MDVSQIAMMAMASQAARTQQSLATAMVKQQAEAANSVASMLEQVSGAGQGAAPAGMGQTVDVTA